MSKELDDYITNCVRSAYPSKYLDIYRAIAKSEGVPRAEDALDAMVAVNEVSELRALIDAVSHGSLQPDQHTILSARIDTLVENVGRRTERAKVAHEKG